jgi:hypothetical protein
MHLPLCVLSEGKEVDDGPGYREPDCETAICTVGTNGMIGFGITLQGSAALFLLKPFHEEIWNGSLARVKQLPASQWASRSHHLA